MGTLPPKSPAREEISFPVLLISPALEFLEVVDLCYCQQSAQCMKGY